MPQNKLNGVEQVWSASRTSMECLKITNGRYAECKSAPVYRGPGMDSEISEPSDKVLQEAV